MKIYKVNTYLQHTIHCLHESVMAHGGYKIHRATQQKRENKLSCLT